MHLLIHTTYSSVDIALCTQDTVLHRYSIAKHEASANLIVEIDALCKQAHLQPADLNYIVACVGPAPFTTLRTSITTANGIAFACDLKLVGVDGLSTFVSEYHKDSKDTATVALVNAYASDVYYAIAYRGQITTGIVYGLDALKKFLQNLPDTAYEFVGNGVGMYQDLIQDTCGSKAVIHAPVPDMCSLQAVVCQGWLQWQNQEHVADQLSPLYLKSYSAPLKAMKLDALL